MSAYITGAAMMEPDVRLETNRLGFCKEHFDQIIAKGKEALRGAYSGVTPRRDGEGCAGRESKALTCKSRGAGEKPLCLCEY